MNTTDILSKLKKEYVAIQPSALLREHGWDALQARIKEEESLGLVRSFLTIKKPLFFLALAVLMVILGGAGTVYAAQSAKPGDRLYPVKIASERITASLVPKPWKDEAAGTILNRRVTEAQEAAGRGDDEATKRAKQEYERSVDNLRAAGALTSDVATKAAQKAKETIDAITIDIKKEEKEERKEEKNEEKREKESPIPVKLAPIVPPEVKIPPLPPVDL